MAEGPEKKETFDLAWELQFWITALIGIVMVWLSLAGGKVPDLTILVGTVAVIGISLSAFRTLMRFAIVRGFVGLLVFTGPVYLVALSAYQLMTPPHGVVFARWESPDLFERFMFIFQTPFEWPGRQILFIVIMLAFLWVAVTTDMFGARARKD